jgi:mannose-1-phosphate guanylyltransferase
MQAGWADIGSWNALWAQGPHDERGNVVRGEVELIDSDGCLVWSEGKMVGAIGLDDLVIVQTDDAVVVAPKSRAQEIRRLVERMAARSGT